MKTHPSHYERGFAFSGRRYIKRKVSTLDAALCDPERAKFTQAMFKAKYAQFAARYGWRSAKWSKRPIP